MGVANLIYSAGQGLITGTHKTLLYLLPSFDPTVLKYPAENPPVKAPWNLGRPLEIPGLNVLHGHRLSPWLI